MRISQGSAHQSAMDEPCPAKTTFVMVVFLLPGKYIISSFYFQMIFFKKNPSTSSEFY